MKEMGISYSRWGGSEELVYDQLPNNIAVDPDRINIKSSYFLIKVKAISVNPVDWKILSGSQRLFTGSHFPRIFGSDFSGEIYNMGKSAAKKGFSKGDRVMGMVSPIHSGSGRQWLLVKANHCLKIPEKMSFNEAASLTAAGLSAILATGLLRRKKPGKVLIIGAGGGVGSLVLQVLAFSKWDITAVARDDQYQLLQSLGCDHFLDRENWSGELNREWDAIIDGPAAIIRNRPMKYLKRGGVYSPVFIPDPFIAAQIFRKILWFFSSRSTGLFLAAPTKKRMRKLGNFMGEGAIRPLVDNVWKSPNCSEAVAKSIKGGVNGKIVIEME